MFMFSLTIWNGCIVSMQLRLSLYQVASPAQEFAIFAVVRSYSILKVEMFKTWRTLRGIYILDLLCSYSFLMAYTQSFHVDSSWRIGTALIPLHLGWALMANQVQAPSNLKAMCLKEFQDAPPRELNQIWYILSILVLELILQHQWLFGWPRWTNLGVFRLMTNSGWPMVCSKNTVTKPSVTQLVMSGAWRSFQCHRF